MYFSDGAAWFTVGYSIYLIIDGLRLEKNAYPSGSSSRYGINLATGVGTSGNLATIKNCILKDSTQWDSGTGAQTGIYVGDKDWNVLIYNNVFYNWKRTSSTNVCIATDYDSNPLNIYNNTFINSTKGIRIGGNPTITIKNNIFQDDTADVEGTIDTQATNLTDLTDVASGLTAGSNVFESALTFINKTGNNYHLSTSDTSAINAGSDLSGTFTTDIDGTTRSGTWDIGADEYVASAPAGLTSSVLGGGRFGGMKIHY
jgi:parallel beta-helix repeat protein